MSSKELKETAPLTLIRPCLEYTSGTLTDYIKYLILRKYKEELPDGLSLRLQYVDITV